MGRRGRDRALLDAPDVEEALRQAHEEYRDIFDNAVFGIFRSTPDGRVIALNTAAARIYGYDSPEELMAAVTDIRRQLYVEPARREELLRLLDERGLISGLEAQVYRKDGSVIWIAFTARAIRDATGAVAAYEGMVEDITERKRTEASLTARAQQQAAVADLGQKALSGIGVGVLMKETVTTVARTLGVESCHIMELLPGGESLLLREGTGWQEGSIGHIHVGTGTASLAGYTLHSRDPVVVEDLRSETRFAAPPYLLNHGIVSAMSVAIPGPIGVLAALTRERRTFTRDDVHFLEAVAHVLAATILRKQEEQISARAVERVISAQDEERKRIARELHDETGQSLTALLLGLREIEDAKTATAAKAAARRLRRVARRTVEEVGRLARGLHPSLLDDMGLVAAAMRLAQDYSSAWGFRVDVSTRGLRSRLRAAVERALYRILQEALTNAARHGRPRRVTVALQRGKTGVVLSVKDDGAGFDASRAAEAGDRHLGLLGMRERAAILGGTFSVQSKPNKGTEVLVRIPLDAPKTARRASPSKKSRSSPGG